MNRRCARTLSASKKEKKIIKKGKRTKRFGVPRLWTQKSPIFIGLFYAETEITGIKDDGRIKKQTDIDLHGPSPYPTIASSAPPTSFFILLYNTYKFFKGH